MRLLRRRLREDHGVTVTEVMVTIALLSVVVGFVLQGFASLQNASAGADLRMINLGEARLLMDTVTKDLRTAVRLGSTESPFLLADDKEVTFYANLNLSSACPKKVHLYVDADTQLLEEVTEPNAGGTPPNCTYTGASTTRFVGQYVANSPSEPIFTYYYDSGGSTDVAFGSASTPLSAADLLLVNGVGVRLSIRKDTNYTVADTTLINKVRLPNVDYNPLPSGSPSP
jgi:prepilin-type N-terminal cleavage/methylation domain-containing protein